MLTSISSFFLSLTIALGSFLALFVTPAPAAKSTSELENANYILQKFECADKVIVVEAGKLSDKDFHTAVCLQGLVNRVNPSIYIVRNNTYREYLSTFEKAGKELVYNDPLGQPWTLPSLISEFDSYIKDKGYVLYRESEYAEGLNVAFNYATAYGWLAFPESQKTAAENYGLTLKLDLTEDDYDYDFQKKHFNILKSYFSKTAIVHVKTSMKGLRDLAIQQKFWIGYTKNDKEGRKFLGEVLDFFGDNTAVLGWGENEVSMVDLLSEHGCFIVASDHSCNNSYIANFTIDNIKQKHTETKVYTDPNKHYLALIYSDGDNSQFIQNDFGAYFQKLKYTSDFPMTWTFCPLQQEISPVSMKRVYDVSNANNYFVAGCSGFGYTHPSQYKLKYFDKFTQMTASALLRSDISIFSVLDSKPSEIMMPSYGKRLDYYTRFENIDGGLVMMDPGMYAGGGGRVWFSNDKPVLATRFSLWYPGEEGANVEKSWIEEQARIINETCKADINSINGYSLMNVHAWTITMSNLEYFVSLLDDDIQLVTADELLATISANCPHKYAIPD